MAIRPPGAGPFGTGSPNSARTRRAAGSASWKFTPTSTTPWSRYARQAASRSGASSRHGTHQEAQKFTTTTLPRCSASANGPPSNSASVNGAAGRPRSGERISRGFVVNPEGVRGPSAPPGRSPPTPPPPPPPPPPPQPLRPEHAEPRQHHERTEPLAGDDDHGNRG